MANEKVISTQALISKFQYALDNHWGYIWGTAGDKWTEEKQRTATREQTQLYGRKWIGHYVADCSGLFSWAFKQLGGYMYHGSNTMYKSYCTSKGKLTDWKTLKPGTALFTGTENDHGHVGLYIGNGEVIEAKGTQAGVIKSKASDKKWTYWGELKGVDYSSSPSDSQNGYVGHENGEVNQGFPADTGWHPTIRRGSKGQDVVLCQTMLYNLGYDIGHDGIDGDYGKNTEKAVKEFQRDNRLQVDGVCGPMTWDALQKAVISIGDKTKEVYYTVTIKHLNKKQVDALQSSYRGCDVTEEKKE